MTWLLLVLSLALALPCEAVLLKSKNGTLALNQTIAGGSENEVDAESSGVVYSSMTICYQVTLGSATIQTEYRQRTVTDFATVKNSSMTLGPTGTSYDCFGITQPQGIYRTNITFCGACNVTTTYELGPKEVTP